MVGRGLPLAAPPPFASNSVGIGLAATAAAACDGFPGVITDPIAGSGACACSKLVTLLEVMMPDSARMSCPSPSLSLPLASRSLPRLASSSSSPPTLGMGVTTLEGLVAEIASLGLAWDVDRNTPRRLARELEADRSAFSSWEPTAGSAATLFRAARNEEGNVAQSHNRRTLHDGAACREV